VVDVSDHEGLSRARKRVRLSAATSPPTSKQSSDKAGRDDRELMLLRFDIADAARILKFSRATLYNRISSGEIQVQKDGRRTYITRAELERYVRSRG
jgi:excisionase family DNA binding protein